MSAGGGVVVIDPAFLGDVVFDAPLVRELRTADPGRPIGLVVRPPADAIARSIPGVDRVHVFDKHGRDAGLSGLLRAARALATARYHTALIPHPSLRSVLLARLAGIPERIGSTPSPIARLLLTAHRPERPGDTFVSGRLGLLGASGEGAGLRGTLAPMGRGPIAARLDDAPPAGAGGEASATDPARPAPASRGSGAGTRRPPRVGLVLGSQWETKRWPVARFAVVARALLERGVETVWIGSAGERDLYHRLRLADPDAAERAIDTLGSTVDELIATIAGCDVLLGGDTGPLHIARALGVPVVALFGPTTERRHIFAPEDRVVSVVLACRPCSAHGGRTCPEGHHRCMNDLAAESVIRALDALLATVAEGRS